jgi:hypothetical protein
MPPAEEFSDLRDWFAREKREPAFWVAIILPWVFAIFTIGVPAALVTAFPFSDAKKTLPILQRSDVLSSHYKVICKLPQGTYFFGYDLWMKLDKADGVASRLRVCRDVNGGWVSGTI